MIFSDGKRSCVIRTSARGKRPLRAEPVDADAMHRSETRPGQPRSARNALRPVIR